MSRLISAIVTVYNRATLVAAAVASLAMMAPDQLEILVVDDGSTDESAEVVERLHDPRVRLLRHDRNLGIPAARNTGLDAARGDYIAWLDSDDLARPDRLAAQAAFLDANPDVAMVGACAGKIGGDGRRRRGARVPLLTHDDIRAQLMFRSAFQQSSIMGRAEIMKAYPYNPDFPVCEDFEMFARFTATHRAVNLDRVLVDRRLHEGQTIHLRAALIRERTIEIARSSLSGLRITADLEDLDRHVTLGNIKTRAVGREFLEWSEDWLDRLGEANRRERVYDPESLAFVSGKTWLRACLAAGRGANPGYALDRFVRSPLTRAAANRHGRAWFVQAAGMLVGLEGK